MEKTQEQAIADILKGVDYEDSDSSQGIRLNQMLRKYISRKARLEERDKQVRTLSQIKHFTTYFYILLYVLDVRVLFRLPRTLIRK